MKNKLFPNFFIFAIIFIGCTEVPPSAHKSKIQTPAPTYKSYILVVHVEKSGEPLEKARLELFIHHESYPKSKTTYTAKTNNLGNYYWEVKWEEVNHHTYELSIQEPLYGKTKRFRGRVRFNEKDEYTVHF